MNRTRYWWPTASTEDRLHQVKHAIEARLTQGETATLLGTTSAAIAGFAKGHELSFADSDRSHGVRRAAIAGKNAMAARITSWRNYGLENDEIADRLDNRREVDDGDSHELRF